VNWLLYNFGRFVFSLYLKVLYRLKIHNAERIPRRKPFIICSNHIYWLDPLAVAAAFPASYKIHFMAKKEIFSNIFFSYILKKAHAFPVNRQDADYSAVKKAYQLLKEGQVLGLFPEGSRSKNGEIQKAYNGAALISVRSGVPILPIAIAGPYGIFKPVHIYIGPPFALPPLIYEEKDRKRMQLDEMSCIIMNNISELLPKQI
jgi:1-acyl-sn-glycerol-3-phosphate acyltransferase